MAHAAYLINVAAPDPTKRARSCDALAEEYARCAVRDAVREDMEILENCQENLMSGVITSLPLNNQEVVLRHNHRVLEQAVRALDEGE